MKCRFYCEALIEVDATAPNAQAFIQSAVDNAWDLRDDQMLIVSGTHCAVRLVALDFASLKEATDQ